MKKKILFVFFIFVFSFMGLNTVVIYAQEDSVWISSVDPVPPETTVTVQVRLKTTVDLAAFEIPLTFRNVNNLQLECDSIHWSEDWFWANEADYYSGKGGSRRHIDNIDKTVMIYALWVMDSFPSGDDTLCTIYFTTKEYWNPDTAVRIDTFHTAPGETPHWLKLVDPEAHEIFPGFTPGFLGPGFIPELGDVNCSREIDISDVYYLIVYLFKFGPAPCFELWVGDVNCDAEVNIADVVYLINYLFKGGPPPC